MEESDVKKLNNFINILEDFYPKIRLKEQSMDFWLLKKFIQTGDIHPDWAETFRKSKLEEQGLSFETFIQAQQGKTDYYILTIEALFEAVKKENHNDKRPVKQLLLCWFYLFHKWPKISEDVRNVSEAAFLKFYIISYACLGIKTPFHEEIGWPLKTDLQISLIAYMKIQKPNISDGELAKESGINRFVIHKLKDQIEQKISEYQNCEITSNDPFVDEAIADLKEKLSSI